MTNLMMYCDGLEVSLSGKSVRVGKCTLQFEEEYIVVICTECNRIYIWRKEYVLQLCITPAEAREENTEKAPDVDFDLSTPIRDMYYEGWSARTVNALVRQGIDTLGDLVNCTKEDLVPIKNFGRRSLEEVVNRLSEMGLSLKEVAE